MDGSSTTNSAASRSRCSGAARQSRPRTRASRTGNGIVKRELGPRRPFFGLEWFAPVGWLARHIGGNAIKGLGLGLAVDGHQGAATKLDPLGERHLWSSSSSTESVSAPDPSLSSGKVVRIAGLEPAQVTPLPPQSSASANSAICATGAVMKQHCRSAARRIFPNVVRISKANEVVRAKADRVIRQGFAKWRGGLGRH